MSQKTSVAFIESELVSHSLFGCCCDTRRGTGIVCIAMIAASIISLPIERFGLFVPEAKINFTSTLSSMDDTLVFNTFSFELNDGMDFGRLMTS